MTLRPFANETRERIHWVSLYLGLPHGGVAGEFPTDAACEARLHRVRWPDGPVCPKCFQTNVHLLDLRKIQTCRNCKKQFSLTSGTDLHRIHRGLKLYFDLAEEIIQYQLRGAMPTLSEFQDKHRMAYATAFRLRRKVSEGLRKFHGGLLGRCICTDYPEAPQDVVVGSQDHLRHLEHALQQRRWQSLGIE